MFIKVALIILGIYLIVKALIRGVFSYFVGSAANEMNNRMRQQQEEISRQKKKQEGRVTVNYQPKQDKNFGKEEGDYVDFEEVK